MFRPNASGWAPFPFYRESIAAVADGFEVTLRGLTKLRFTKVAGKFQMRSLIDPYGIVTRLDYDDHGMLSKVTDASGHFLQLKYRAPAPQRRAFALLGTLEKVGTGWQQIDVPSSLQNEAYRYVQVRLADHVVGGVAEVQFFAPGSDRPLRGIPFGSSAAEAAFDGNAATSVASVADEVNLWGLDLGAEGASRFDRVRVLAKSGEEAALKGLLFDAYGPAVGRERLLEEVSSSNGETVRYSYEIYTDPWFGLQDVALSRAQYGDGSAAVYRYENLRRGGRPLLVEADDPLYEGRAKHVRYSYWRNKAVDAGFIHQEINPVTGGVYASLELDAADLDKRIVHFSDLRSVIIVTPQATRGRPTERTDSLGRKTRWEYEDGGPGQLAAVVDSHGRRNEFRRDARGDLIERTDAKGRKEQIVRNAQGRIEKQTDPTGRETRYVYDAQGRVAKRLSSNGKNFDLTYDELGRVTSIQAPGGVTKVEYNPRGLRSKVTDSMGAVTQFTYDAHDRLATETDPLGRVTRSERDARGRVTKLIRPDGTTIQTAYDNYGRIIAKTDAHGHITKLSYDELGRVTRRENHNGDVTVFDYTELPQGCGSCTLTSQPSRIVHPDGSIEKRLYDSEGRLLAKTAPADTPAEATTTYAYDEDDNLVSVTDPLGRVTRFTYDDDHHRLTQTDPLGRVTKWTYDLRGNVLTATAPDGGMTKNAYDDADRLLSLTNAVGNVTRYDYDEMGNLVELTDAAVKKTRYTYDGKRLTATRYPDRKSETRSYDALGRMIKTVSADGLETSMVYDAGDRPLEITRVAPGIPSAKAAFTYDALGRRISATDPIGRTTRWTYDAAGNVLTTTRPDGLASINTYDERGRRTSSTDEAGNITRYGYNAAGDMTTLTDARGNAYRFTYDAQHRKTAMIYPDDSRETWTYDLAGNQTSFSNRAGQTKMIAYNSANQPVSETWNSANVASNVAYSYDAAGRLVKADNGHAKLAYTYDGLGRLASETSDLSALVPGLDPHTVIYRYDELGRRSELIYPDRTEVSYAYDARGRLTAIDSEKNVGGVPSPRNGQPLATYDYSPLGQIAKLTRDNGVATAYTYDMAGQLTDITHAKDGTLLASSRYTLDPLGRRTAQTREDGITETYGYDSTGQLTSADYGNAKRGTFAYDPVGNRTSASNVGGVPSPRVTAYTSNSLNQYIQLTVDTVTTPLTYDAKGNLTNDGKQAYTYDAQNRLISVTSVVLDAAAIRVEFFYDARNRCVLRRYSTLGNQSQWVVNAADSRAFTYDTAWNLIAERQLDGVQVGDYIHGQHTDEILVSNLKSQRLYPLADGLGSTVALTDDKSQVTERHRYDIFGTPTVLKSDYSLTPVTSTYRLLFTGREWLSSVGLNDHRHRYYVPVRGRWLTPDPIREEGGENFYAYVSNRAATATDPVGLCAVNAVQNPSCEIKVTALGTTPEILEAAQGLVVLAAQTELFFAFYDLINVARTGGKSLQAAIDEAASLIVGEAYQPFGNINATVMAQQAYSILSGLGASQGYKVWTSMHYQKCKCGWIWNSWENKRTDWVPYSGFGDLGDGGFLDPAKAYRQGTQVCQDLYSAFPTGY